MGCNCFKKKVKVNNIDVSVDDSKDEQNENEIKK